MIGSMNRGGLDGASWTMDDRFTGYDAAEHRRLPARGRQDAAADRRRRPGHGADHRGCAPGGLRARRPRADGDGRAAALRARRPTASLRLRRDTASLARAVTVASALGTTSAYTWLKLPACDDPDAVFARDHAALRRARRRPRPRPRARTWPVLGARAAAADGPRPRRRAGPALPARTATWPPPWTPPPAPAAGRSGARTASGSRREPTPDERRHPPRTGRRTPAASRSSAAPRRTPAGRTAGCRSLRLAPGVPRTVATGESEVFVLPLAGSLVAQVEPCAGTDARGGLRARRPAARCSAGSPTSCTPAATAS